MLRHVRNTLTFLILHCACFPGAGLLTPVAAFAQSATLTGIVNDTTDARVPGATVELVGAGARLSTQTDANGSYTFANVRPGTYELTVSLVGFAQARKPDVRVDAGPVDAGTITLALAAVSDTIVVSATRNEIALVDAPATMSIVDETVLASTPAQNYGDLLRGVPGLNVIQLSARDINLTSRQATSTLTNSQLVLLDGRSLYLDFFGLVLWDFLPNNIGDIRQIEVVRGPASAVWGANALTGVVNIITKTPREAPGTDVTLTAGFMNRNAGSGKGQGLGGLFGANASRAFVINDRWSYRVSAGYYASDPLARPTGRIPVIADPRAAGLTVGGASYPLDADGTLGTAFRNRGTSQPKFDMRVDQELAGNARITYQGGVAGTEGIVYTGLGPFDMQPGSLMGYAKANYARGGFQLNAFTNIVDAEAPNLLLTDPTTGRPLQLNFSTQTYDVSAGDVRPIGSRQVISVGGNVRRNNFEMTVAPAAKNRTEIGGYIEDSIFLNRVNLTLGARVDKFGNLEDPVFSPRISATVKVHPDHALRASFNRAFRSPSVVNNYLDTSIVNPVDLSGLAPLLPAQLQPLVANPFPLVVKAVGSELPIGAAAQTALKEEQLTAYEIAYTGTLDERTTMGVSFYVNDLDNSINFAQLPPTLDPYTTVNPPPGWQLPAGLLTAMAARGIYLPRTAFTYLNLGPIRQKGLELSVDHRFSRGLSMFANYSWQDDPTVLDDPDPYPTAELALPPTHRFNAGVNADGARYLGSLSVNYSDRAFWSDVLTSNFHGFTDGYTLVNASAGRKWQGGKLTTMVKVNNLLNQTIQQHVFGDLLKTNVSFEARIKF
ncbi:MAG: TonB-dependent receptor [Vicinamibacterales bacterium]